MTASQPLGWASDLRAQAAADAGMDGDDWHRAAFEHAPVGIAVCDLEGRFLQVNGAWKAVLSGTGIDAVAGRLEDLGRFARRRTDGLDGFGEDWPHLLAHLRSRRRDLVTVELPLPSGPDGAANGPLRWVRITVVHVGDTLLCHLDDVTSRRGERERLARLALRDSLTGLANRRLTGQRLDEALREASQRHRRVGVCYLDLDGFKQVNDALGHDVGDQLLIAVARRLSSLVRAGDTAGRIGGDEFVVVAAGLRDETELAELAARLERAFEEPLDVAGRRLRVGASVGSVLNRDGDTGETLVVRADAAMFAAKRRRRRSRTPASATTASMRRIIVTDDADVRQLALLDTRDMPRL